METKMSREVVVVSGVRTAIGTYGGSLKDIDLQVRPIHHHLEDRVRAHVFLCMLGWPITWNGTCARRGRRC